MRWVQAELSMAVGSATLKDGTPIVVRPVDVGFLSLLDEICPRLLLLRR